MQSRKIKLSFTALVAIIFIITLPDEGLSQSATIKGVVSDAGSNEILLGANIILTSESIRHGMASHSDGGFEFKNLSAGTYLLTVTYLGYIKQTIEIDLQGDETKALEIKLTPSKLTLNPVSLTLSPEVCAELDTVTLFPDCSLF